MRPLEAILRLAAKLFVSRELVDLREKVVGVHQSYCRSLKSSLTNNLVTALLVAEDRRFFYHGGVDVRGIIRCAWQLMNQGLLSGGSTIEQQLVRTLTGKKQRTVRRKIREMMLATWVPRIIPKEDIPGVYLSVAYFGWEMNGLACACIRLGLSSSRMSRRQAASIVARLKYPEPCEASKERCRAIEDRVRYILANMERTGIHKVADDLRIRRHEAISNE